MTDSPVEYASLQMPNEDAILKKVTWRLLPFLFALYVVNLLDRTNVGIAKLRMLNDLGMDEAAYGFGFAVFYIGYVIFEVPSNLILARVGARVWIARIVITWGIISCCMMFVRGPWSFYTLRILLGVAEAGFFPGIILYLSQWFPARVRARTVARFMVGAMFTGIIGNPLSGAILQYFDGTGGLHGWQWVFLLEGIPAVLLGIIGFRYLTDSPEKAEWLEPAEREWLVNRMNNEKRELHERVGGSLLAAMLDVRVWLLIGVYFMVAVGDNTFSAFLPTLIKKHFPNLKEFHIGLLAAVPSVAAIGAMVLVAGHSDRTGERRWHIAISAFVASIGWVMTAYAPSPMMLMVASAITLCGMKGILPTFWTLPSAMLSGTAAAGGIALINSVGNLGGYVGPSMVGKLQAKTGNFSAGLLAVAVALALGGILVLCTRRERVASQISLLPASGSRLGVEAE